MERIVFLLMLLGGLYWLMRWINSSRSSKSPRRPATGSGEYMSGAGSASLHATPGNNLLADKRRVWNAHCQHTRQMGSRVTGSNFPHSFERESETDNFNRIDRHHLMPEKEEEHIGGWDAPNVEFKPAKSQQALKSH
jgi:hypothetical protein